jgi:hypothetical protein
MMSRSRPRRARAALALFAALALTAALAIATSATGETVRAGNLVIGIEGQIKPKKLPRKGAAPLTLKLQGKIATADGSPVPALKTLALQFDKHGSIFTKGLPTCTTGKLEATNTAAALKACRPALVGRGKASAEIYFAEQPPFGAHGPMLIFNGKPKGGRPVLIFHVFAHVPAPTTFVTSGVIEKGHGKYGTQTEVAIPTIVAGQGSLTSFEAKLGKTWRYKGKKVSLLSASCPSGSLFAHGEFKFADGTKISGNVAKRC